MAASLPGDGVALSALVLAGLADDRSRTRGIGERKVLSAPTTDTGGLSSASISQRSSSKSGAIWTQSCPSYKLSAAPRDCSGSQGSLAHPRASVLVARRADGTGCTRVALQHLVSPARGSPAEPGEPGPGTHWVCRAPARRGHLNTLEDLRHGGNARDGHVWFWLAGLGQASPEQQLGVGDKAGEGELG